MKETDKANPGSSLVAGHPFQRSIVLETDRIDTSVVIDKKQII